MNKLYNQIFQIDTMLLRGYCKLKILFKYITDLKRSGPLSDLFFRYPKRYKKPPQLFFNSAFSRGDTALMPFALFSTNRPTYRHIYPSMIHFIQRINTSLGPKALAEGTQKPVI